jgi:hypothetical protein
VRSAGAIAVVLAYAQARAQPPGETPPPPPPEPIARADGMTFEINVGAPLGGIGLGLGARIGRVEIAGMAGIIPLLIIWTASAGVRIDVDVVRWSQRTLYVGAIGGIQGVAFIAPDAGETFSDWMVGGVTGVHLYNNPRSPWSSDLEIGVLYGRRRFAPPTSSFIAPQLGFRVKRAL